MVPVTKGAPVPEHDDLVVASDTGEYADVDLILCASVDAPDVPTAMYQAQFVRYGGLAYQFDTPEALGEALVALEPDSTHDAAQLWREELARRTAREKGTLVPENPADAPDATSPEQTPVVPEQVPGTTESEVPADDTGSVGTLPDSVPGTIPDPLFINDPAVGQILAEPDPSIVDISVPEPIIIPDIPEVIPVDVPAVDLSTTTPQ